MKVSSLAPAMVVAALSLLGTSCSSSSVRSTPASESSAAQDFDKHLEGTINNKIEIGMRLVRQGNNLSGNYSYKKVGVEIPIKGTISGKHFVMSEYGGKDGSQSGQFEGDFSSDSDLNGNWTNATENKVMAFSLKEKQAAVANSQPTSSSAPSAGSSSLVANPQGEPAVKTGTVLGQLPIDKVQRAVDKALDWTRKGGRAAVLGIQEIPRENAARADLRFDGFQYNANSYDMPISRDQKTPPEPDIRDPNWGQKMYQNRAGQVHTETYSGQGTAILKHYTDGRWVLTGVQFGLHGVDANIDVK